MVRSKFLACVLVAALILSAIPVAIFAADEVGKTIFYANDFNDAGKDIKTGAVVVPKTNKIERLTESNDNGYVKISLADPVADDGYFEATIKGSKQFMVTEMAVSAEKLGAAGNLQFRNADKKESSFFKFNTDGVVLSSASEKELGKLTKGKWLNLAFAFDMEKRVYNTYVNGKQVETNVKFNGSCEGNVVMFRMYIAKTSNGGGDLMMDNFRVYEGTEPRDISGEVASLPSSPSTPVGNGAIEITPPPAIEKMDSGVALLLDSPNAYAKKTMTKVDPQSDMVMPVVVNDRTLVPVRFIAESFGAKVDWDPDTKTVTVNGDGKNISLVLGQTEMNVDGSVVVLEVAADTINDRTMIPLRALVEALGKNVFWDPRGLILITNSDIKIDATADSKLVGAMYGYLKSGTLALNYAVAPDLTQTAIDDACAQPPIAFGRSGSGSPATKSSKALYYLTLATLSNPETKATNGMLTKDAALAQVRSIIAGGREPFACSGPYWGHAVAAAALVIVKNTPAVYNELTQDEKDRMDWLMKALAIVGNWSYNDKNNYSTGFDLMGNFGKGWNPNYRNTYLSVVLSASLYFGGADKLDAIYTSFSYDEYMKKFEEYGFSNISNCWAISGKNVLENGGTLTLLGGTGSSGMKAGDPGGTGVGVKIPFTYQSMPLSNAFGIFEHLMRYTYSSTVRNDFGTKGGDDYSYIISGKTSPFTGKAGMMLEFAGGDGGGIRSSASYCYESFMIINAVYANFKLFGGWDSSTQMQKEIDSLIYVGTEDLIFKLEEGYAGYSTGKPNKVFESGMNSMGYFMDKDLWRAFHQFSTEDTVMAKNAADPNVPAEPMKPAPSAAPKDGITEAPAGALKPALITGTFAKESFFPLDKKYTDTLTTEFDLVFSHDVDPGSGFDAVIMYDSAAAKDMSYAKTNVLIQLAGGTINIRDGAGYKSSTLRVAPNYRYHFKVNMDVKNKKVSVWVTPTYPEAAAEVQIADNYAFRAGADAISDIGTLMLVAQTNLGTFWLENHTVK